MNRNTSFAPRLALPTNTNLSLLAASRSSANFLTRQAGELLQSIEADIYPLHRPDKADLIDGSIGEGSVFAENFGYYAQGVGPETATLPQGWQDRLVKVQSASTDLKIGWCLEPHDLAASKLAAAREKDREFVSALLRHGLIRKEEVEQRIAAMPVAQAGKQRMSMPLLRISQSA